jgi:hypothetical protein
MRTGEYWENNGKPDDESLIEIVNRPGNVLWPNPEARSCKHCCSAKAIRVTYSECMCSLSYPTCNAHSPYCHLWPGRFYNILPHYLIKATFLEKKRIYWTQNAFFLFPRQLAGTFLSLRRTERYMIKNTRLCSCEVPVILVRF